MNEITLSQVMKHLEQQGDEKVRFRHVRNGAGDNVFGVLLGWVPAWLALCRGEKTEARKAMDAGPCNCTVCAEPMAAGPSTIAASGRRRRLPALRELPSTLTANRLRDARRQFARVAPVTESYRTSTRNVRRPRTLHSQ
jgi:hypothetical protein